MVRIAIGKLTDRLNSEISAVENEITLAQQQINSLSMSLSQHGLRGKAFTAIQERLDSECIVAKAHYVFFIELLSADRKNLQAADKLIPSDIQLNVVDREDLDRRIQNLNSLQSDSLRSNRNRANPTFGGRVINPPNPFAALSIGKMLRAVLMSAAEVKAILEEYLYSTNNIYGPVVSMCADSGLISRITKVADAAARTGSWNSPGLSALRYEVSKAYNDTRIKQSDEAIDNNVKDPGERQRLKYTAHRVLADGNIAAEEIYCNGKLDRDVALWFSYMPKGFFNDEDMGHISHALYAMYDDAAADYAKHKEADKKYVPQGIKDLQYFLDIQMHHDYDKFARAFDISTSTVNGQRNTVATPAAGSRWKSSAFLGDFGAYLSRSGQQDNVYKPDSGLWSIYRRIQERVASIVTQINAMASRGVWTRRGDPLTFDFTVQSGGIENIDADYVTVSVNGLVGDDSYPRISGGNTDSVWENVSMSIVGRPSGVYQLLGFLVGNYNKKSTAELDALGSTQKWLVEEGMNKFIEKAFVHGKDITPYIGAVLSLLDIATDYVEEKNDESYRQAQWDKLVKNISISNALSKNPFFEDCSMSIGSDLSYSSDGKDALSYERPVLKVDRLWLDEAIRQYNTENPDNKVSEQEVSKGLRDNFTAVIKDSAQGDTNFAETTKPKHPQTSLGRFLQWLKQPAKLKYAVNINEHAAGENVLEKNSKSNWEYIKNPLDNTRFVK